jgi:iron complex outermembrane receptor protein
VRHLRTAAALAAAALAVPAGAARARQQAPAPSDAVVGRVVDAAGGAPVAAAQVTLVDGGRTATTGADGRFVLAGAGRGVHTVAVRRIGYAPATARAQAGAPVDVRLRATALALPSVTVRAPGRERRLGDAVAPGTVLEGAALDRQLAGSVAATVAGEPGVTMRTNGPMAAQPVVRGLTGDRVLVLEDGQRTGDVATTAPDHAVTIDPMTARRVEVVRGPAGLLYGGSVLGGLVNVVREDVPRARPARVGGFVGAQGESANAGGAVGGALDAPLGPLAVRATGSWRVAGDTRTPRGALPFTDVDAHDAGIGASWAGRSGFVGVAARDVRSAYGVPSSFGGLTLPGSHVGGVYVTLRRSTVRGEASWRRDSGAVRSVDLAVQGVRFEQDEQERGGFVGTRFGQLAASGDLVVRYQHRAGLPADATGSGAVGVWGQWRDFRAAGSYTGTRPAEVRAGAVYGYEEVRVGRVALSAGARLDRVRVAPLDSTPSRLLPDVRTRDFGALSGALAAAVDVRGGARVGVSVARGFRPPAVEELYSAGPHLATYAYEIGNPALRPERGRGADLFARVDRAGLSAEVAGFVSRIDDFVFQAPLVDAATGLPARDPRLRRYPVYQAAQAAARLVGAEGRVQWELPLARVPGLALDATASWVRGTRLDAEGRGPLPAMPPLRARAQLRRERPRWFAAVGGEGAARQGRVPAAPAGVADARAACVPRAEGDGVQTEAGLLPAEFCPTPGWALLHASAGVRLPVGARLHALTLSVDNALDATWRDHLWRAKQVAPQPGRNVRLLYRVTL